MNVAIRRLQDNNEDMQALLSWLTDERVLAHVYDEDAPWDPAKIRDCFAENAAPDSDVAGWMILLDGSPVGYMQHYPITEDSYRFTEEMPYSLLDGAYGTDMFIGVPKLWRKGIGRQAVELLATHLKELGVSRLCADPCTENDHGMAFWPRVGFIPLGAVPEYDHPEKTSVLMVRAL